MAIRTNEYFIGNDKLNIEGSGVKHPATIQKYASINTNKAMDKPIKLHGLDVETNHKTGELKLLGIWDGVKYSADTSDFLPVLYSAVKEAEYKNISFAYWRKLEPFIIFKQFVLIQPKKQQRKSLDRFGKINGKWDDTEKKWIIPPVVSIKGMGGEFGIIGVIRSSIQFYFIKNNNYFGTVWAFDISGLYESNLQDEALGKFDPVTKSYPNARLPYYEKGDESLHKIDWKRFEIDPEFRAAVLRSNELDARAACDLGNIVMTNFKKAFGYYPNSLISAGSLTRAAIIAQLKNKYIPVYEKIEDKTKREDALNDAIRNDAKSIPIVNYLDQWREDYGDQNLRDMLCMFTESYSGGYIESIRYGCTERAYMADIASAYPSVIVKVWDLRGSHITFGTGAPPSIPNSYCFIRGDADIPQSINFNPITVKHPFSSITNIRAVGQYRCTYIKEARDFIVNKGGTFDNESWINIETTGKLSPLAEVCQEFLNIRAAFLAVKDSAQDLAKRCANSIYGITFEATDVFIMNQAGEIVNDGFRAGEFYNPIFASYICGMTRIKICECASIVEDRGGKVIVIMTDSIFYKGDPSMFPAEYFREKKTVGYFEKPELITKLCCLGAGRYEFNKSGERYKAKTRGFAIENIVDPEGILISEFKWLSVLKIAAAINKSIVNMNVRVLVSVGMISDSKTKKSKKTARDPYTIKDLGRIVSESRAVDVIAGKEKRMIDSSAIDYNYMLHDLIDTESIYLSRGMEGTDSLFDQTLPLFREEMMKIKYIPREEKTKMINAASHAKHRKANSDEIHAKYKEKYDFLRKNGIDSKSARSLAMYSWENIYKKVYPENQKYS